MTPGRRMVQSKPLERTSSSPFHFVSWYGSAGSERATTTLMWMRRRTPAAFIASISRATRSTCTAWNVWSFTSRLMPARLTTASQPRSWSGWIVRASHPFRRDSTRTDRPASRRAAQTWRPRNPVPPTTAISPMVQLYEHVHNIASELARDRPGIPMLWQFRGAGTAAWVPSLEGRLCGERLKRPPPHAEEHRPQGKEPEQRPVHEPRRNLLGILVRGPGEIHRRHDPHVVEERND